MDKEELKQEVALATAEDEKKGSEEQRYITLTEEELKRIAAIAAQEGAAAYKREQEATKQERAEKVRNSAKTLIIHYRRLKKMKDTSVYDTETVTDPTLAEIFGGMLGQIRREEFNLTSTNKNRIITGMLMNHVDVQLENYRKECDKSKIPDIARRYRVVEMMYLRAKPLRADEVAEIEVIDKSNVYRTLEKAYDDLAVLFFGVEGMQAIETGRKKRAEKRSRAKKAH